MMRPPVLNLTLVLGITVLVGCTSVPQTPEAQYQAGQEAAERGDLKEAFEHFEATVKLDPGHRRAQLELVALHMREEEPDYAVSHLTKLIEHLEREKGRSPDANLYARRGQIFYQAGNYEKALQDTSRALELDETSTDALNTRGYVHLARDEFGPAREHFSKSLRIKRSSGAYLGLAEMRMRFEQWDEAIELLDNALEIDANIPRAYRYRAVAHRELDNTDRMAEDLVSFLTLSNPEVSEQDIQKKVARMMESYRKEEK